MQRRADLWSWALWMPGVFVVIWSTGFIVARYGMPNAPPLTFLAWRYVFSLLFFVPWVLLARVAWPRSAAQWWHLGVTGVFMHAGYLGGVWAAVKAGMGSGLVALIVGLQPVLTAAWESSRTGIVTRRQWLGLCLGFAGLVLVVGHKLDAGGEATVWNVGLALLALVSITVGTLYQKRFVQPCDVRSANTVQLLAALGATLPFLVWETESMHWLRATGAVNGELIGALAWSVLGLTVGGSSLLFVLIQRGAATQVTSLLYLVPPTTAAMAWVLFAEPVTVLTCIGTLLTAAGVSLVIKRKG